MNVIGSFKNSKNFLKQNLERKSQGTINNDSESRRQNFNGRSLSNRVFGKDITNKVLNSSGAAVI